MSDLSVASLFDFHNHVVLVTGGATGLGEMAASGFVQNGAKVFIASRKEKELSNVRSHTLTVGRLTERFTRLPTVSTRNMAQEVANANTLSQI